MTNEEQLREKLRRIEALFAGATTEGERLAAAAARDRIRAKLADTETTEPAVEFQFNLADTWGRKLFTALCRRYGVRPYRYKRQRRTTLMVKVPRSFMNLTLWPEYLELRAALEIYLNEATDRIIREEVFGDDSEAPER